MSAGPQNFRPYNRGKSQRPQSRLRRWLGDRWFDLQHWVTGGVKRRRSQPRPHAWKFYIALAWIAMFAGIGGVAWLLSLDRARWPALGASANSLMGENHPAVGAPLARLRLEPLDSDDAPVDLSSLAGRVLVINFWGTWNTASQQQLPYFAKFFREHAADTKVNVLSVTCGQPGHPETRDWLRQTTGAYLEEIDVELPTYIDFEATTRKAAQMIGAFNFTYPCCMIVDGKGVVRAVWDNTVLDLETQLPVALGRALAEQIFRRELWRQSLKHLRVR